MTDSNDTNVEDSRKQEFEKLLAQPQVESWRMVMACFKTIISALEPGLLKSKCSIPRFEVLLTLYFDGPQKPVEIARKLMVTRGNISTFLRRMVDDGLLQPVSVGKKARPEYMLTDYGTAYFEQIFPDHIERVLELIPSSSEMRNFNLVSVLKHVQEHAHKLQSSQ